MHCLPLLLSLLLLSFLFTLVHFNSVSHSHSPPVTLFVSSSDAAVSLFFPPLLTLALTLSHCLPLPLLRLLLPFLLPFPSHSHSVRIILRFSFFLCSTLSLNLSLILTPALTLTLILLHCCTLHPSPFPFLFTLTPTLILTPMTSLPLFPSFFRPYRCPSVPLNSSDLHSVFKQILDIQFHYI